MRQIWRVSPRFVAFFGFCRKQMNEKNTIVLQPVEMLLNFAMSKQTKYNN